MTYKMKTGTPMRAMFDAMTSLWQAEIPVVRALKAIWPDDQDWCNWTTDSYDNSLEVYELQTPRITDEQANTIFALGFDQFWLHWEDREMRRECRFTPNRDGSVSRFIRPPRSVDEKAVTAAELEEETR